MEVGNFKFGFNGFTFSTLLNQRLFRFWLFSDILFFKKEIKKSVNTLGEKKIWFKNSFAGAKKQKTKKNG